MFINVSRSNSADMSTEKKSQVTCDVVNRVDLGSEGVGVVKDHEDLQKLVQLFYRSYTQIVPYVCEGQQI
jgi:hypothetical protein